jgi:hypothetical protein
MLAFQLTNRYAREISGQHIAAYGLDRIPESIVNTKIPIQRWIRDNPLGYLSMLNENNRSSPVAKSLIQYVGIPENRVWDALRVSKDTIKPPFIPKLFRNGLSFVAILDNGQVVAWGSPYTGGLTPTLPEGRPVRSVSSNDPSHVALLDNGTVVAWGAPNFGGRTPTIPVDRSVRSVYSNRYSHVALLDNGTVVAWGDPHYGGLTPPIPEGRTVGYFK